MRARPEDAAVARHTPLVCFRRLVANGRSVRPGGATGREVVRRACVVVPIDTPQEVVAGEQPVRGHGGRVHAADDVKVRGVLGGDLERRSDD
jgi:hypothetical protein